MNQLTPACNAGILMDETIKIDQLIMDVIIIILSGGSKNQQETANWELYTKNKTHKIL